MVLRPLGLSRALRADRVLNARSEESWFRRGDRGVWLAVGALTILALALRLARLDASVLGDEVSTLYIIRTNDLAGTVSTVSSDAEISPPLYFILAWLSSKLGSAPELMRLPSLIAGTASIPLTYLVGARAVGRAVGLVAAAVMALSPFMIFYSTDGRTYALAIALLLGSTLAMLAAVRTGRTRWWVAYGALTAIAMYTHYTSAFVLGAQLLWLFWAHPEARKVAVLANVGAVVAFLPWLPSMLNDFDSPTVAILAKLQGSGFEVKKDAAEVWAFGYPYFSPGQVPGQFGLRTILIGLLVAGVAALVRFGMNRAKRAGIGLPRPSKGVVLLFALGLATPLTELVILLLGGTDLLGARNMNTSSAGLALSIGAVLVGAGPIWGTLAAVAVFGGFSIGAAKTLQADYGSINFKAAAAFVDSEAAPGDVVVDAISAVVTPVPLTPVDVYRPQEGSEFRIGLPSGPPPFLPFVSVIPPANGLLRGAFRTAGDNRIFLLVSAVTFEENPGGKPATIENPGNTGVQITLPPGAEVVDQREWTGVVPIQVFVIDPDPEAAP